MLSIEYVKLDSLKPYENNAKLHPDSQVEQIKKSIEQFGFNDPIAVWKDNTVVEGHGRLLAAFEMGLEEVPIIRLDNLTDEQRRAYTLVHNKLTMNSDFDGDLLLSELEDIDEIDMADFGFDLSAFDDPVEAHDDNYAETDVEKRVKRGDVWKLGDHMLMCGDATSEEDAETLMGGGISGHGVHRPAVWCLLHGQKRVSQ